MTEKKQIQLFLIFEILFITCIVFLKEDTAKPVFAEDYMIIKDVSVPLNNFEPSHEWTCEEPDQMIQSKKEYCSCEKQ